jgi:hypothetical protein
MPQLPHRDSGTRRGKNTDDTALANTSEFCNTIPPKADIAARHLDVRFVPILLQKSVAGLFGQ